MVRWLPIGLLAFALAAVLIGCKGGDAPRGDGDKKESKAVQDGGKGDKNASDGEGAPKGDATGAKVPDGKPVFEVTAEELATEFVKDGKAADAKYNGKIIGVSGEVTDVSPPNAFDLIAVTLKGVKRKPADSVEFDIRLVAPPGKQAKDLPSKGQKTRVVGKYANFSAFDQGGYLNIVECTFSQPEASKTPAK